MRRARERGNATVELAMALPAVVAMLGVVLAAVAWSQSALRVHEAASVGARVALTDGDTAAAEAARRVAPDGSRVHIDRKGGWITVHVEGPSGAWLPPAEAAARIPEQ